MKLQLAEPGYLHTQDLIPAKPIIRWTVRLPGKHFYIIGFNLGRPGQKSWWRIVGREGRHCSALAALAVLQQEFSSYTL